jgi:beta-lactamase class A
MESDVGFGCDNGSNNVTQQTSWHEIETLIADAEETGGSLGVVLVAPNGDRFEHNPDRRYRAASTVKIPLMVEVYRQIDRGERSLTDEYVVTDVDRANGSGVMLHLHSGATLNLNDLIYLMISISDNTATNVLIDYAGIDAVNATMRDLGMSNSVLGRKMKGRPAQGDEQENWATAADYIAVVLTLLDGRAASPESCERMIAMLETQQNTHRISRFLPEVDGLRWGSKTGSVTGVTNDVGFVITDRGTLLIAVFCEDLPDQHVGEEVIGKISRAAIDATGILASLPPS